MNESLNVVLDPGRFNNYGYKKTYRPSEGSEPMAVPYYIGYYKNKSEFRHYKNENNKYLGILNSKSISNGIDLMKLENLNKIDKMSQFDDNWDGNGSLPFSEDAICLFRQVIENLEKQPQIAPTGRNSLYMQYEQDDNSMLAYELSENKTEEVFAPNGDYSKMQTRILKGNIIREINGGIEKFYGFGEN